MGKKMTTILAHSKRDRINVVLFDSFIQNLLGISSFLSSFCVSKIKTMKKILSLAVTALLVIIANSQGNFAENIKAQSIKDWERAKAYTKEYLDAMPADKYGFKAQDSVRSFAQQMLHLASANVNLSSNGTGKDRLWQGRSLERSPGAQSKDSVTYFVNASYDFVIEGIKALDATKLDEAVKRGNSEFSRLTWTMKAFEHQTHHRGQATIYIRLAGIKPPNEKLF
jgi:uncharacterized damage-inducible protein DinB